MRVTVEGFKSVKRLNLEIGRVTVLIGPPSSGKSNFLEALALLGYGIKVSVERALGFQNEQSLGLLSDYIRLVSCRELTFGLRSDSVSVSLNDVKVQLTCDVDPKIGHFKVKIGNVEREYKLTLFKEPPPPLDDPLTLFSYLMKLGQTPKKSIIEPKDESGDNEPLDISREVAAPRLYSFDRLGVYLTISQDKVGYQLPPTYLHERAINIAWILTQRRGVLEKLNEVLEEYAKVKVIPTLRDVRFSKVNDSVAHSAQLASDTAIRIAYYITAVLSNKLEMPPLKPILLIEEPEAHIYPLPLRKFIETIKESDLRVVITTHDPRVASEFYNAVEDCRVYFVKLEKDKSRFYEMKEPSYIFHDIIEKEEVFDEMIKKGEAICVNCAESESVTLTQ